MIDSHLHVNYKGMGASDVIAYMDRARIDQCWLLTWEEADPPHPYYGPLSVEDVFEAFGRHGPRIVPMYAPDPARPDAAERLKQWVEKGFRGCGELKCVSRWDSPEVGRLLETVDRLGLPLVFHMEGPWRYYHGEDGFGRLLSRLLNSKRLGGAVGAAALAAAESLGPLRRKKDSMDRFFPGYLMDFASLEARVRQFPGIKFVGHGPLFWKGFTSPGSEKEGVVWRLMESYPNMHADLSASGCLTLKKSPALAKRFLDRFSGRLLYGTDNLSIGLKEFLDSLGMGPEVYRRVYGENAAGLTEGGRKTGPAGKRDGWEREAA